MNKNEKKVMCQIIKVKSPFQAKGGGGSSKQQPPIVIIEKKEFYLINP